MKGELSNHHLPTLLQYIDNTPSEDLLDDEHFYFSKSMSLPEASLYKSKSSTLSSLLPDHIHNFQYTEYQWDQTIPQTTFHQHRPINSTISKNEILLSPTLVPSFSFDHHLDSVQTNFTDNYDAISNIDSDSSLKNCCRSSITTEHYADILGNKNNSIVPQNSLEFSNTFENSLIASPSSNNVSTNDTLASRCCQTDNKIADCLLTSKEHQNNQTFMTPLINEIVHHSIDVASLEFSSSFKMTDKYHSHSHAMSHTFFDSSLSNQVLGISPIPIGKHIPPSNSIQKTQENVINLNDNTIITNHGRVTHHTDKKNDSTIKQKQLFNTISKNCNMPNYIQQQGNTISSRLWNMSKDNTLSHYTDSEKPILKQHHNSLIQCPNVLLEKKNHKKKQSPTIINDMQHRLPAEQLTMDILTKIPKGVNGELLSVGSINHAEGTCKPCLFLNNPLKQCNNGIGCLFCHHHHPPRVRVRLSKKKLKARKLEKAQELDLLKNQCHRTLQTEQSRTLNQPPSVETNVFRATTERQYTHNKETFGFLLNNTTNPSVIQSFGTKLCPYDETRHHPLHPVSCCPMFTYSNGAPAVPCFSSTKKLGLNPISKKSFFEVPRNFEHPEHTSIFANHNHQTFFN